MGRIIVHLHGRAKDAAFRMAISDYANRLSGDGVQLSEHRNRTDPGPYLQSIVENKYPVVKKLIIEIGQKKGCYFSRMTGSGSVCYGVFKSEKTAKDALNRIKLKYPKYWSSVAKTI